MKRTWMLLVLAMFLVGCDPLDETPVKVKVVTVWTRAEYDKAKSDGGSVPYPHVVLERLDNGERIMKQYDTWGKTGDVFAIKLCNLHW